MGKQKSITSVCYVKSSKGAEFDRIWTGDEKGVIHIWNAKQRFLVREFDVKRRVNTLLATTDTVWVGTIESIQRRVSTVSPFLFLLPPPPPSSSLSHSASLYPSPSPSYQQDGELVKELNIPGYNFVKVEDNIWTSLYSNNTGSINIISIDVTTSPLPSSPASPFPLPSLLFTFLFLIHFVLSFSSHFSSSSSSLSSPFLPPFPLSSPLWLPFPSSIPCLSSPLCLLHSLPLLSSPLLSSFGLSQKLKHEKWDRHAK